MVYNICLTSKAPYKACSAFTRVAACTLAPSPIRDTLIEGFSHFVTSMTAPIASSWSGCRVGLAPTGKRRLCTAHAINRRQPNSITYAYGLELARDCQAYRQRLDRMQHTVHYAGLANSSR